MTYKHEDIDMNMVAPGQGYPGGEGERLPTFGEPGAQYGYGTDPNAYGAPGQAPNAEAAGQPAPWAGDVLSTEAIEAKVNSYGKQLADKDELIRKYNELAQLGEQGARSRLFELQSERLTLEGLHGGHTELLKNRRQTEEAARKRQRAEQAAKEAFDREMQAEGDTQLTGAQPDAYGTPQYDTNGGRPGAQMPTVGQQQRHTQALTQPWQQDTTVFDPSRNTLRGGQLGHQYAGQETMEITVVPPVRPAGSQEAFDQTANQPAASGEAPTEFTPADSNKLNDTLDKTGADKTPPPENPNANNSPEAREPKKKMKRSTKVIAGVALAAVGGVGSFIGATGSSPAAKKNATSFTAFSEAHAMGQRTLALNKLNFTNTIDGEATPNGWLPGSEKAWQSIVTPIAENPDIAYKNPHTGETFNIFAGNRTQPGQEKLMWDLMLTTTAGDPEAKADFDGILDLNPKNAAEVAKAMHIQYLKPTTGSKTITPDMVKQSANNLLIAAKEINFVAYEVLSQEPKVSKNFAKIPDDFASKFYTAWREYQGVSDIASFNSLFSRLYSEWGPKAGKTYNTMLKSKTWAKAFLTTDANIAAAQKAGTL